jgi:hypothetical protein
MADHGSERFVFWDRIGRWWPGWAWPPCREKAARQRAVAAEQAALTEACRSRQVVAFLTDMLRSVGPSVA